MSPKGRSYNKLKTLIGYYKHEMLNSLTYMQIKNRIEKKSLKVFKSKLLILRERRGSSAPPTRMSERRLWPFKKHYKSGKRNLMSLKALLRIKLAKEIIPIQKLNVRKMFKQSY